MKKSTKNKITSALVITGLTVLSIHLINKLTFALATGKDRLNTGCGSFYKWRFGNVFYKKQGSGKPLLLIHDLNVASSAYEWNRLTRQLAESHTVYTIDLIGCGRSDKPKLTYTNYLYVQLITDFIKNVIGHKTDVAVTGLSGSFVMMACNANPDLFDRIMIINPESLSTLGQIPRKRSKTLKFLIETPVIGTLIYNMCTSKQKLKEKFRKHYFSKEACCSSRTIEAYHEAAHLGKANAKYLFASLKGHFVNINIAHALKQINNSITLICGTDNENATEIMDEYMELNPSIEKNIIADAKYLPQLEKPSALLSQFKIYFN